MKLKTVLKFFFTIFKNEYFDPPLFHLSLIEITYKTAVQGITTSTSRFFIGHWTGNVKTF